VLTVRKDLISVLDSEMGQKLSSMTPYSYTQLFGKELGRGHGEARDEMYSLGSIIRAYMRMTDSRRLARAKKWIQNTLVWATLTRRRYAVSRSPNRRRLHRHHGRDIVW
jgi:hypothetical protein